MKNRVAINIEDGSFTFDTRVQRQVRALVERDIDVFVVCPSFGTEKSSISYEKGATVIRYPAYESQSLGFFSRAIEYAIKLSMQFFIISYLKIARRIKIVQFCNPSDFSVIWGKLFSITGGKYIFDQHDLVPEIYAGSSDKINRNVLSVLHFFERWAYKSSDHVIVVNDSFKLIATLRGGISNEKISIVRNGPGEDIVYDNTAIATDLDDTGPPRIGYIGNINPQDGLDLLVEIARKTKDKDRESESLLFVFDIVGDGGYLPILRKNVEINNLNDYFVFHGRKHWGGEVENIIKLCKFCIQPDPDSDLNNKTSMTKSLEYLALGKTFIAFPLKETLFSCRDYAIFAKDFSEESFCRAFFYALEYTNNSKEESLERSSYIEKNFSWSLSRKEYVDVYERLLNHRRVSPKH